MNFYKYFLVFAFVLTMFVFPQVSKAQYSCPPENTPGCGRWYYSTLMKTLETPDCYVTVFYHWRLCGWEYQIYIDSLLKVGNCEYLGTEDNSTFQEWLELAMIEEIVGEAGHVPVTDCPTVVLKTLFYTASCGLWVKCEYEVSPATRTCDADWRGEYPDYTAPGGKKKVKIWKFQACGVTCCKKTYSICRTLWPTGLGYDIHIEGMTKEKVGDCTNPDNFVTPCQDGC